MFVEGCILFKEEILSYGSYTICVLQKKVNSFLASNLLNRSTPSQSGPRSTLHSSTISLADDSRYQIHIIPSRTSCLIQKSKPPLACEYPYCSSTLSSTTTLLESSGAGAT